MNNYKKESNIQKAIMLELDNRGCIVNRVQVGLFLTQNGTQIHIGKKGQADLQGHRPDGKCFYLETKSAIGKAKNEQIDFINAMKATGAIAGVCNSVECAIDIVFGGNE